MTIGHKKTAELLIEKGSNVIAVENKWKWTPLHYIASIKSSSHAHEDWTEDDRLSNFNFVLIFKTENFIVWLC